MDRIVYIVMDKVIIKAPAKINLFLKVLGRRTDGYHDIHSLFQAVSLFDELEIRISNGPDINLRVSGNSEIPTGVDNLVFRAARLMQDRFGFDSGFEIDLKKRIPVSAGLGGGSADAAATIFGINRLLDLGLDSKAMARLGLEIGSDVPFFFSSGQAEVTGRGEKLNNVELPLDYSILLVTPALAISTKGAYEALKMPLTSPADIIKLFCFKDFKDLVTGLGNFGNDFETRHCELYSELVEIRDALINIGAELFRMSGTGPTMFGLFGDIPEGEGSHQLGRRDWQTDWVNPITLPAWD